MTAARTAAIDGLALGTPMSRLVRLADAMIDHPAIALFVIWLLQMAYLGALQLAGLPFGFDVWPMGEDRNWLRFMQDGAGLSMMHQFWAMNDRNPLSPWWYWLFRWPIYYSDYGLYVARKLVDPLLAITVALLLGRLFRYRGGPLPLLAGLLVLNFNFSDYREQIAWNFLLALGVALLATHCYLRHVDGRRSRLSELGPSLWLFLLAIATYTLDVGLLAGIAAIALLRVPLEREQCQPPGNPRDRVLELGCFVAMALSFFAIWYTVSRASSSYYALDLALIPVNALSSLRKFLWHPDYTHWLRLAAADRLALVTAAGMLALPAIPAWIVVANGRRRWQVEPAMLGWTVVLLLAIGTPIVALESTSSVWLPGFRSRMIYQVSAPLLAVLLIGAVCLLMRHRGFERWSRVVASVGFLTALALVVPASVEYNRQLVEKTALQREFAQAFVRLANERDDIRSFLVRYAGGAASIWGSDALSDTYAKTLTRRDDVSMRLIPDYSRTDESSWWRIVLRPDDKGVRNYAPASSGTLSYRSVLFVDWDGRRLSVPSTVDRDWFDGLQVDWERAHPIVQSPPPAPTCPSRFDFSTSPFRGRGWSVPERLPDGRHAIWMASEHASMQMRTRCVGEVELRLAVANYMTEGIVSGLKVRINGVKVPISMQRAEGGRLFMVGRLAVTPADGRVTVELDAPGTIIPPNGNRRLAVMFSELVIRAAQSGS